MAQDRPSTPDPQSAFDRLVGRLAAQAEEMASSQARMRELIRVNLELTSNLDLPDVLRQIVRIGADLVQARYAAIGVVGDEKRLEQFVHVGMDDEVVARIDHLPEGKGLLGALIDDPAPVRLTTITSDGRSSGFPAHHPPMQSFLGVPILVRGEVFGNLYLTDSLNGAFSESDEELAQSLAAAAAIAVANARLFEAAAFRERWASSLAEISHRLMSDDEEDHLAAVVETVRDVAGADLVAIALVSEKGDRLRVERACGVGAADLTGSVFALQGTFSGRALAEQGPVLVEEREMAELEGELQPLRASLGAALFVPFGSTARHRGVLSISRAKGSARFDAGHLELGRAFAGHTAVALDQLESQRARRRVALLEDRSRIARDLHDHVIQRLFATGLNLQAAATNADPALAQSIATQIEEIDGAIAQIRQSIFAMRREADAPSVSARARVLEIVDRVAAATSARPRVTFLGPVDLIVAGDVVDDVVAVVSEALSNAVRHAQASSIDITVSASSKEIGIEVVDDGVGVGDRPPLGGLVNLRERAVARGGGFEIDGGSAGGTRVRWTVPA